MSQNMHAANNVSGKAPRESVKHILLKGVPVEHDDDPARAVACGIAMQKWMQEREGHD